MPPDTKSRPDLQLPRTPRPDEAEALQLPPATSVILAARIAVDAAGRVVEINETTMNAGASSRSPGESLPERHAGRHSDAAPKSLVWMPLPARSGPPRER